ncbi:hypothetical protein [Zavarzinella formosa]|uniref:hypothetical protein n=1 Tax=Zavarzinella formosa TaxID=360055 RepID=UPI00036194D5|nr:hypothetical protein [Zavarzinella formosa]
MNKRRWLYVGLALLLFGGVALVILGSGPPVSMINRKNFDRLQEGMTRQEIFGCPPGSYDTDRVPLPASGRYRLWWATDDSVITIEMRPDGDPNSDTTWRMWDKNYLPIPPETLSERWRRFQARW